ncbi:Zinc-finger double domain containing protein 3 [Sarcoptes scabiei]|uniref:Zinc-finger double domain containing protein 3 n=1 Tax=Sarcoptes scabiei TaxID=52283 RepID=A0A132A8P3_SARSC|nr:Zinc-finger double domain containing protein 3 [Sarcoptes scabiei]
MLIDQLLSPKNSIRNRHLKKALLTIKSSSTKLRDKNNDNNNNTIGLSDSFEMNDEIGEEKTKLSSNILVSKLDDSGAKMNHSDRFKCGSSSSNSSTLAISETFKRTRYSGVGRYRCPWPECSYTPHFLRDLRRHMFKHTGDKRYKCSQCRFVSVWKTSLLQHQRKKHGLY